LWASKVAAALGEGYEPDVLGLDQVFVFKSNNHRSLYEVEVPESPPKTYSLSPILALECEWRWVGANLFSKQRQ
jgi:hypothetical protein